VNDLAGVLQPERAHALEQTLERYEHETGHQIVLLTVPSLEGDPIEDFSIRVAEAWKIGHAGLDNGIILIVAPQDRAARIEVGYGLEGVVPDAVASRILQEVMFAHFREARLADGIEAGLAALMAAARGERVAVERRRGFVSPRTDDPLAALFFASFFGGLFGAPLRRGRWRALGALVGGSLAATIVALLVRSLPWSAAAFVLGGLLGWFGPAGARGRGPGAFGGGFGGGRGGFGGGGGGFGGGGASGRW
jgi:uncharacterized protein